MSNAALAIRIMVLADGLFETDDWWNEPQDKFGGKTGTQMISEDRLSEVYEELLAMWNAREKCSDS